VPLSEHEQRALEQIERALYAEDPKFAQSWRARADVRSVRRARIVRGIAAVIIGLGLLLGGVVVQADNTVLGVALGVVGFLLMLGGAWLALSTRQRPGVQAVGSTATSTGGRKSRGPRQSIIQRLDERFQQRRDSGNTF
jgi:hypothetical protein